jgi:pyruvate formate lyase activating enzyme
MTKSQKGYIHSLQTLGTLDGPGLRTVVFFQGCSLRCKFCHNADTIPAKGGKLRDVSELAGEILKNKAYWGKDSQNETNDKKDPTNDDEMINSGTKTATDTKTDIDYSTPNIPRMREVQKGGVTFSGGDPLFQPHFALELAKELKSRHKSTHIAVDTNLNVAVEYIDRLIEFIDLWMVSIKHLDPAKHEDLTGCDNKLIQKNIRHLDLLLTSKGKSENLRIRFVIIPTITDSPKLIDDMIEFAKSLKSLELVELLPYTSMGKDKWIKLIGKYPLEHIPDATDEDVKPIAQKFKDAGIKILT